MNLKIVEQECYSRELIHKFSNLTLKIHKLSKTFEPYSQTLANIVEIFQNIYHVDLHFTYPCGEFVTPALFFTDCTW